MSGLTPVPLQVVTASSPAKAKRSVEPFLNPAFTCGALDDSMQGSNNNFNWQYFKKMIKEDHYLACTTKVLLEIQHAKAPNFLS